MTKVDVDQAAKDCGFASEAERNQLVEGLNLDAPGALEAFFSWESDDNTKVGLLALYTRLNQVPDTESSSRC